MPRVAASRREAFLESRRAALVEAALRLWAERGFDATPVADIAAAAGVSKGALYLYFPSKQALLEEVLRRYTLLPDIERMVADLAGTSFEEAVRAFVRRAWRHLTRHRHLALLVLRELPTHLDRAEGVLEHVFVPTNRLIAAYLENQLGAERGREISLVIAGRALIGMVLTVFVTQEIVGAGRFLPVPEDEITATIAEVFLNGVRGAGGGAGRDAAGSAATDGRGQVGPSGRERVASSRGRRRKERT